MARNEREPKREPKTRSSVHPPSPVGSWTKSSPSSLPTPSHFPPSKGKSLDKFLRCGRAGQRPEGMLPLFTYIFLVCWSLKLIDCIFVLLYIWIINFRDLTRNINIIPLGGVGEVGLGQALTRVSLSREKSRVEREISLSISKIWYFPFLFLLSIFESGNKKFSFYSRFSRVERKNSLSTLDFREFDTETLVFSLDFWEFKLRVQHHL